MAGRKSITQRIGLEGGEQIKSQLDAIGKAGGDAFKKLQDAGKANNVLGKFSTTLDSIKAKAAELGEAARDVSNRFTELGQNSRTSAKRVAAVGVVITGLIVGFAALTKGAAHAGDEIAKTAAALNLTTSEYQELAFATSQAGVSQEKFASGQARFVRSLESTIKQKEEYVRQEQKLRHQLSLGKISFEAYAERLRDIRFEASTTIDPFKRLGVTIARNKDGSFDAVETQLRLADAVHRTGTTASTVANILEIYGRGNLRMVGFLKQGRAAIEAQRKEAQRLGLVIGGDVLKRQEKLNDAFDKLGKATTATRVNMLAVFSPTVTRIIDAIVEAMARWRAEAIKLATDLANKAVPLVDDFIALLEGRDKDIQNSFIVTAKNAFLETARGIASAVTDIIVPALKTLLGVLEVIAQAINGLFGTEFTGKQIAAALIITKLIGLFAVLRSGVLLVVAALRLLAVAFGGVPLAIALVTAAIGVMIFNAVGGMKGIKSAWNKGWTAIKDFVTSVLDSISSALQRVANFFVNAFKTGSDGVATVFNGLLQSLQAVWDAIVKIATDAWTAITTATTALGQTIVTAFQSALQAIADTFKSWRDGVLAIFDAIVSAARTVARVIASALGGSGEAGAATGGEVHAARGGFVRGSGTATSDSIRARLSNGEFVQRAKAVRKYGVDFMHAINSLRPSVSAVRSLMGGFNMGGLAQSLGDLMPRTSFADGGLALAGVSAGGRPVNLHFGGELFQLSGTDDVVGRLERRAAAGKVRSAGRKPTWFQG